MFDNCNSLTELNLEHFNTNNVKNMSHMFNSCILLSKLNINNFNTSQTIDLSYMFAFDHS